VSQEKLEPRLGERHDEELDAYEQPLAPGRDAAQLFRTLDAQMQPIDLLRCKLSFFGATQFDPRSDRWLRICLFAGAPHPSELVGASHLEADQWIYPTIKT